MPRVKLPPTPISSTGPTPQEKTPVDMEGAFSLPPATLKTSPPTSPVLSRKRTLSGSAKSKDELPPPPSRARKIIQMKPKEEPPVPTTSTPGQAVTKGNAPQGKKKQPSVTSAAGRRIARKTAHSIIERRRRSKMNEEFGVLKDMIPACKGVEMHKLAILQAGIEYVRYLQGCVEKLQDREKVPTFHTHHALSDEEKDDEDDDEEMEHDGHTEANVQLLSLSPPPAERDSRRGSATTTATTSTYPSPALVPNASSSSLVGMRQLPPPLGKKTYSTSPPPLVTHTPLQTGVSPAFNAIHFSPDLSRTYSQVSTATIGKASPNILPLPQAAMPVAGHSGSYPEQSQVQQTDDVHAEATATAALMMMGNDRRRNNGGRGGGMSVRDLLSH